MLFANSPRGRAALIAATLAAGCVGGGVFYKEHLTGTYAFWAVDGLSDNSLVEESDDRAASRVLIGPTVFAAGFDDKFIIAARHPRHGSQVDRGTIEYYAVSIADGKVYGPVARDGFAALRAKLGIPSTLEFSVAIEQLASRAVLDDPRTQRERTD